MIITIDGPSSSGKSTVAKLISKFYSIVHIDSGSIYRAVTLLAIENNLIHEKKVNIEYLLKCLEEHKISFRKKEKKIFKICINDKFIDKSIRTSQISNNVSIIAAIKEIRDYVLKLQRKIAKNQSVVMDGRDIGSVVFPNAKYKFFLEASLKNRSKRRWNELKKNEKDISLANVKIDLNNRDILDTNREHSPLVVPKNSIIINSDKLSVEQVVEKIIELIK